jgi:DNA-binding beta-propeller fold protein YncE
MAAAQAPEYRAVVVAEARDEVTFIKFTPGAGAVAERTHSVGVNFMEPDGPHGVSVSPDGTSYYVTTAHGTPYGYLWKFDAATHGVVGRVELGNFPASLHVSRDGGVAYVVNFNLHGDMVPSSVSIVSTDPFVEMARVQTCAMPHGSRLSPDGTKHYSVCMMDETLVEIDTRTFSVARHFMLTRGQEHGSSGPPMRTAAAAAGHGEHGGHGAAAPPAANTKCSPTWAQPDVTGRAVFVACNASNDIAEIAIDTWELKRRIPAGEGVYNLAATRDGTRLVATNKRGQSVSVIELPSGRLLATIATQRRVVHGVAITPDDRYAFVSVEGIGSEPGTVEVIDLRSLARVASVDVGQMAGGIDIVPGPQR